MRSLFAAVLFTLSASSFASGIVKVTDGAVATCNNMVDFLRHQTSAIYQPHSFTFEGRNQFLKVEFLKCVKNGEEYRFERDSEIERTTIVEVKTQIGNEVRRLKIERSAPTVVAYNSLGRVLSRSALLEEVNGMYVANLAMDEDLMETTILGLAFNFAAYSTTVVTDLETGLVVDSGREFLGSYGLIVK